MASPLSTFLQHSPLELAELLQCSQQPSLVAEARDLILNLPDSLLQETQELLPWLSESALVLVLAHCTTRRGRGGPAAKPGPLQDSNLDMTAATRKAANRQAAALSKLRTKLNNTAGKLLSAVANKPGPSATSRPFKLRLNSSLSAVNKQPMKRPAAMPPLLLSGSSTSSSSFTTPSDTSLHPLAYPAVAAAAEQNGAFFAGVAPVQPVQLPLFAALPAVSTGGAVTSHASLNLQQQLLERPQPIDAFSPPEFAKGGVLPLGSAATVAQLLDAMLQQEAPAAASSAADDGEDLDFGVLCESLGITDW